MTASRDLPAAGSTQGSPLLSLSASDLRPVIYEISAARRDETWDALLGAIPESHYEQLSGWGTVKAQYGWDVFRIFARVDGQLVGGIQVLTRRLGGWGKIGYVARGPAVLPGWEVLEIGLAEQVSQIAKRERWLYGVFDYPYGSHRLAREMAGAGYLPHPSGLPPSGLLSATSIIDLTGSAVEIGARMSRNTRRNLRTAAASNLVFSEGGLEELPRFRELMVATCARRRSAPTPPQKDYFLNLWQELGHRGSVRLFTVKSGTEMVAGLFAFAISDTVRLWKTGWSGNHADECPNHLVFGEAIRWAKARGFRKLDLVWVDTEDARRVVRGERARQGFRDGTTSFKLGFGGTLLFTPPTQSRFFHPVFRLAFRSGGARLLASGFWQRVVAGYWSGMNRG